MAKKINLVSLNEESTYNNILDVISEKPENDITNTETPPAQPLVKAKVKRVSKKETLKNVDPDVISSVEPEHLATAILEPVKAKAKAKRAAKKALVIIEEPEKIEPETTVEKIIKIKAPRKKKEIIEVEKVEVEKVEVEKVEKVKPPRKIREKKINNLVSQPVNRCRMEERQELYKKLVENAF